MSPDTWWLIFWAFAGPVMFVAWCLLVAATVYCLAKLAGWFLSLGAKDFLRKAAAPCPPRTRAPRHTSL